MTPARPGRHAIGAAPVTTRPETGATVSVQANREEACTGWPTPNSPQTSRCCTVEGDAFPW